MREGSCPRRDEPGRGRGVVDGRVLGDGVEVKLMLGNRRCSRHGYGQGATAATRSPDLIFGATVDGDSRSGK